MKTAQIAFQKVILGSIVAAALVLPKGARAAAGAKVICNIESPCTVGEFLYDDSYAVINSANCTLTSQYPDGTAYLGVGLTASVNGWYSHGFTAPETTGYYPTQLCCTSGEDYLCLDKSFEVSEAANTASSPSVDDIAEAVWGYSGRTLSGFGTLVIDIWGYTSRSLTGFGTLVSDIWSRTTRTLTGTGLSSGNLATQGDVQSISATVGNTIATMSSQIVSVSNQTALLQKTVASNQTLLEQIVNKPIVQNSIEEVSDFGAKIEETKTTANLLFMNSQYIVSRAGLLLLKSNTLSDTELLENINGLNNVLGEETDNDSKGSVFGQIAWFKNSWNWPLVEEIFDQTKAVKASLSLMNTKLVAEGKSPSFNNELKEFNSYLDTLEKIIGDSTDLSEQKNLFGKLRETKELAEVFDSREAEVQELLAGWDSSTTGKETANKIEVIFNKVIAINRIPQVSSIFTQKAGAESFEKQLKNRLLGLRALIGANRVLLAKGAGVPFYNTWLEEGSMVFKSLVTNPSKIVSQKVELKYYLPVEVKKENIIETDEGLTVSFDSEKNQYYVEGTFNLRPGESQTVAVRVADIWVISEDEINSLRKQAEELSKPLDKTSFFAQGVTLKSDIDVSLDKILVIQKGKVTPEERIRAYREGQIELEAVKVKMDKLKELVTQAGSTNNLLGFVGGSQTMAVWGLIIILLAGFVFLAIYMRIVVNHNNNNNNNLESLKVSEVDKKADEGGVKKNQIIKMALVFLAFGALTAVISGVVVWKMTLASLAAEKPELSRQISPVESLAVDKPKEEEKKTDEEKKEESIKIVVPSRTVVNIRNTPSLSSRILTQLRSSQDAPKLEILDEWVKVSLPDEGDPQTPLVGWVNKNFIEEL